MKDGPRQLVARNMIDHICRCDSTNPPLISVYFHPDNPSPPRFHVLGATLEVEVLCNSLQWFTDFISDSSLTRYTRQFYSYTGTEMKEMLG